MALAFFLCVVVLGFLGLCRSTRRYGEKGERFEQLTFLNLAQNVVCFVWSMLSKTLGTISQADVHSSCDISSLLEFILSVNLLVVFTKEDDWV